MNQVYLIVLGSILALITTLIVELLKGLSQNRGQLRNFKIVLGLEMKNLIVVIDKLTDSYSSKNYYEFKVIDQIDRNLQRIEGVRKDTLYLREETKKEEILNYINDIFILSSDLRSLENYAFSNPEGETEENKKSRDDFSGRERQMIALRIIDLKRRGQDIINFLGN